MSLSAGKIKLFLFISIVFFSCRKEIVPVYEIEKVNVVKPGADKSRVKTTTEFISIAYSDIFGTTIPQQNLTELTVCYTSFGDKKLIEDLIIKNFLNSSSASLPPTSEMREDIDGFIKESYQKFFNREPGEYELWWLGEFVRNNTSLTSEQVYYSFLTSVEYRYY